VFLYDFRFSISNFRFLIFILLSLIFSTNRSHLRRSMVSFIVHLQTGRTYGAYMISDIRFSMSNFRFCGTHQFLISSFSHSSLIISSIRQFIPYLSSLIPHLQTVRTYGAYMISDFRFQIKKSDSLCRLLSVSDVGCNISFSQLISSSTPYSSFPTYSFLTSHSSIYLPCLAHFQHSIPTSYVVGTPLRVALYAHSTFN